MFYNIIELGKFIRISYWILCFNWKCSFIWFLSLHNLFMTCPDSDLRWIWTQCKGFWHTKVNQLSRAPVWNDFHFNLICFVTWWRNGHIRVSRRSLTSPMSQSQHCVTKQIKLKRKMSWENFCPPKCYLIYVHSSKSEEVHFRNQ